MSSLISKNKIGFILELFLISQNSDLSLVKFKVFSSELIVVYSPNKLHSSPVGKLEEKFSRVTSEIYGVNTTREKKNPRFSEAMSKVYRVYINSR